MALHTLTVATFRAKFPEFANATTYPDLTIQGWWDMGVQYINPNDSDFNSGTRLQTCLELMTAHMGKSFSAFASGQATGVVNSASEGSVSVSFTPPPATTAWQHWLNTTPYGLNLRALLRGIAAGGFMTGGSSEHSAFRKAGGIH